MKLGPESTRLNRRVLVTVLFASALGVVGQSISRAGGYELRWDHQSAVGDGINHVFDGIAISPWTGHSFTVEISSSSPECLGGELVLLEFDSKGSMVRSATIATRDPASTTSPVPGAIAGIMPIGDDELLILGRIDDGVENSIFRLDRDRKIIWQKRLTDQLPGCWISKAVIGPKESIIAVGVWKEKGFACSLDFNGNVLWTKSYDLDNDQDEGGIVGGKARVRAIVDVLVVGEDDELLLAGTSGWVSKFGMGETEVWLLECDSQGSVKRQRVFPGRGPRIAGPLDNEKFVLLFDSLFEMESKPNVAVLNANLESSRQSEIDLAQFWAYLPNLSQNNANHCVATGVYIRELRVFQLNADGDITRRLDRPLSAEVASAAQLVANGDKVFVALNLSHLSDTGSPTANGVIYCLEEATQ